MPKEKPSTPKGTRDFSPTEIVRRNFIFDTIRETMMLYGFQPIETPAMENLTSLLGKYGEEGDRLIFRILNSGDYLSGANASDLANGDSQKVSAQICEKALRYDLTVPFARYVVQHQSEITFPFKRYQIQPVWRADRPQKGRYREFMQCDADVIGSDSLINEFELLQIIDNVFQRLGMKVTIKINNRKILAGIADYIGYPDKIIDITTAIDKLDKIGIENVNIELAQRGLSPQAINTLQPVFGLRGDTTEKLDSLMKLLSRSAIGLTGIAEIKELFHLLSLQPTSCKVDLDLTLARGLNYYTGAIIEVKSDEAAIGSICGGGRYDNLTGIFGLEGVSGVGISFGADRIYDVLLECGKFPQNRGAVTKVLLINFGGQERDYCLRLLSHLRSHGISAELYPEEAKLKKQMQYANKNNIPYVVMAGKDEVKNNTLAFKDMETGQQELLTPEQLLTRLERVE